MKQFPQPGEHEIMLRHLQTEAGLKATHAAMTEDPDKEARDQERFRKEHPDLFDDDAVSVGEAISVNGELIESKPQRRKKRVARWYSFLSWLKVWGWVIISVTTVYLAFFPVPIRINRSMPYTEYAHPETHTGTLRIKGTYYWYGLKPDRFKGTIQTENVNITVEGTDDLDGYVVASSWTTMELHKVDGDCPYRFLDYFDEYYKPWYIKGFFRKIVLYDNSNHYLAAPAENMDEADKLKHKANSYLD